MNLFNKSKIKESKAVENFNMILLDVINSPETNAEITVSYHLLNLYQLNFKIKKDTST